MTAMRPECGPAKAWQPSIDDDETALRAILRAVNKRRALIRGKLDGDDGKHCAMGCFWADQPNMGISMRLIDEIATVNDSLSERAKPRTRWKRVQRYLRERLATFEANRRPEHG